MNGSKWIDHVYPLNSQEEVRQYIQLWEAVQGVQLDADTKDEITWKWTANGVYSTQSAYQIQFSGVYSRMNLTPIWKVRAEHKC